MAPELLTALLKVQDQLPFVKRTTEAHKYKYAPLEEVWDVVKKPLHANGFFITHEVQEKGVLTTAHHQQGELHSYIAFSDTSLKPQSRGSEITYCKRYNLLAIFNIQVEGEDDDAVRATKKQTRPPVAKKPTPIPPKQKEPKLSAPQMGKIGALGVKELGWTNTKVTQAATKLYGVKTLPELTSKQASDYIRRLQTEVDKAKPAVNVLMCATKGCNRPLEATLARRSVEKHGEAYCMTCQLKLRAKNKLKESANDTP